MALLNKLTQQGSVYTGLNGTTPPIEDKTQSKLHLEYSINGNPNINLIASGGVSHESELYKLLGIGCEGVIIGKAIYEKKISLQTLSIFNKLNS